MHVVCLLLRPGFQVTDLVTLSVFKAANQIHESDYYGLRVVSINGGTMASSESVMLETERLSTTTLDTLIVSSGTPNTDEAALQLLRRIAAEGKRLAGVAEGVKLLAAAGLLDGRRATLHWSQTKRFAIQYPRVKVDADRIMVVDGSLWTSPGASAAIDLAIAMVDSDLGRETANQIAKRLLLARRRGDGHSQHSALLELDARSNRIQKALAYARRNLASPIGVLELAEAARLSPRQFSRAFRNETGTSPGKALEALRIEAARLLIDRSDCTLDHIAEETGFGDRERMRRAFLRAFGAPPQAIRRTQSAAERCSIELGAECSFDHGLKGKRTADCNILTAACLAGHQSAP